MKAGDEGEEDGEADPAPKPVDADQQQTGQQVPNGAPEEHAKSMGANPNNFKEWARATGAGKHMEEKQEGEWSIRELLPRPWPWRSSDRYTNPGWDHAVLAAACDQFERATAAEDLDWMLRAMGDCLFYLTFETIH